jgi:hypothetical protein
MSFNATAASAISFHWRLGVEEELPTRTWRRRTGIECESLLLVCIDDAEGGSR